MKNQEYLNYYFGGVQSAMSASDYKELKEELQIFKEKYLSLPPEEFRKHVKDEYSDLVMLNKMKSFQIALEGINKKLQFFMIITIIGIIGTFIAILTMVK